MENYWCKDYLILSSVCDFEGRLGIYNTFDVFMDLAAEHAAHLGVSYYDLLERNCYWVAVRTRVKFYERPRLADRIRAVTWPGKPGLAKCDRFYRLEAGGAVLAEGRTEWAAQDLETGAVRRADSFGYPVDMPHREERVCTEPFTRFRDFLPGADVQAFDYTVGSMDIDVGRHMNNVAYIRMLLGTFSTGELGAMDAKEMEISYRRGCYEGERLHILRQAVMGGWLFQVCKEDGETAVHAKLLG